MLKPIRKDYIAILKELYEKHRNITLCIDVIYINKQAFLTIIWHPLYYRTCAPVSDKSDDAYYNALDKVLRVYNQGHYKISTIEYNGEFCSMMDRVANDLDVKMNYMNVQDHKPRAERNN